MSIRIILADQHNLFRECLRSILEKNADLEVVAEANNGVDALRLACDLLPDVVLVDLNMSGGRMELTRRITGSCPAVQVLIISLYREQRFVAEALAAGASGFLLKNCASCELIGAVRTVAGHGRYLSPELRWSTGGAVAGRALLQPALRSLTPREREVLVMLAEGEKKARIAELLQISPRTVESHRTQIMKKMQFENIVDLTRFAIRERLLLQP